MFAALPPSSSVSFLRVPATARAIWRPTSVEPVNATLSTPGCPTTAAPVAPAPGRMLTTPGGRSACWQISAKSIAVSGVVSAGLSTTVLPAASAGATFHASMSSGKFQGMTCPATPSGLRRRQARPTRACRPSPRGRRSAPRPAGRRRRGSRGSACRCRGVSRTASSRARSCRIRAIRNRYLARSAPGIGPQTRSKAARAARTARSTSGAVASATLERTSSVAGLRVSSEPPSTGSANSPSTKRP